MKREWKRWRGGARMKGKGRWKAWVEKDWLMEWKMSYLLFLFTNHHWISGTKCLISMIREMFNNGQVCGGLIISMWLKGHAALMLPLSPLFGQRLSSQPQHIRPSNPLEAKQAEWFWVSPVPAGPLSGAGAEILCLFNCLFIYCQCIALACLLVVTHDFSVMLICIRWWQPSDGLLAFLVIEFSAVFCHYFANTVYGISQIATLKKTPYSICWNIYGHQWRTAEPNGSGLPAACSQGLVSYCSDNKKPRISSQ